MESVYWIKKKSNKPLEIDAQQRVSVQATVKHRQFILFKPGRYFCWAQLSFFVRWKGEIYVMGKDNSY